MTVSGGVVTVSESTQHMDEHELRARRLFRKTEGWLYAVPDWRLFLATEYGERPADIRELPIGKSFRITRPAELLGISRAEIHRRLQIIDVVYRTLTPAEKRLVELKYWTRTEDGNGVGVTHAGIAREMDVHRNTVARMRQRVVEIFRRALFGI